MLNPLAGPARTDKPQLRLPGLPARARGSRPEIPNQPAITASAITPPHPAVHKAASKQLFRPRAARQSPPSTSRLLRPCRRADKKSGTRPRPPACRAAPIRAAPAMLHGLQNQTAAKAEPGIQLEIWRRLKSSMHAAIPLRPPTIACAVTGRPPCQNLLPAPRTRPMALRPGRVALGSSQTFRSKQQRRQKSRLQRKFRQGLTGRQTPASRIRHSRPANFHWHPGQRHPRHA
jgi:hypothetical protein